MKKKIGILGVLVAILALGIGYAAMSSITMNVNGNGKIVVDDANFKVHFDRTSTIEKSGPTGTTLDASYTDDLTATISVESFKKKGDEATFVYTIVNESADLLADLAIGAVENENTEYFEITPSLGKAKLSADGDTTTLTIVVKAIKTPIEDDVTTTIKVPVVASPSHS